jgi:hypothetical protein
LFAYGSILAGGVKVLLSWVAGCFEFSLGSHLESGRIGGIIGHERTIACRMSKPHKWGLIGAGVGFCVALLVVAFAYYANSHLPKQDFSIPLFLLAPTSLLAPPMSVILAMTTPTLQRLLVLIFAVSNAFFFGFAFSLIGKIRSRGKIA